MIMLFILIVLSATPVLAATFSMKDKVITVPTDYYDDNLTEDSESIRLSVLDESVTLEGLVDRISSYYNVPLNETVKENYLEVDITYSSLLKEGSTLTISIDDRRVHSVELDVKKTDMTVKIPLSADDVMAGFHNVEFTFYGHIADDMCTNEENPGNWLTLLPTSGLYLEKAEENQVYGLEDFPFPFVQTNELDDIQSQIVIPDEPSNEVMKSALQLSSAINQLSSSQDPIEIIKEKELTTITEHLIVIGSEGHWTGIVKDLFDVAEIKQDAHHILLDNYMLNLGQVNKQVLFITAENDAIIQEKIDVLTELSYREQLNGTQISIDTLPEREKINNKGVITLEDLNATDIILSGFERESMHYFYTLPTYIDVRKQALFHLDLKVSETLFTNEERRDEAELVVFINEVPHSVRINDLQQMDNKEMYQIEIPIDPEVLQKQPYISVKLQGNGLMKREYCEHPDDQHWLFIQNTSHLELPMGDDTFYNHFSAWPGPFVATESDVNTVIVVDEAYNKQMIKDLQLLVNHLGEMAQISSLKIMIEDELTESDLNENHLVFIGDVLKQENLLKKKEDWLIPLEDNYLRVSEYGFLNETSETVAWVQYSPWTELHAMLVIAPVKSGDDYSLMGESIIEFLQTDMNLVNIIVKSINNKIFTHKTTDESTLNSDDRGTNGVQDGQLLEENNWLIYLFIGIMILSLIIFIIAISRAVKRRKRHRE